MKNPEQYDLVRVRTGGWSEFYISFYSPHQVGWNNKHLFIVVLYLIIITPLLHLQRYTDGNNFATESLLLKSLEIVCFFFSFNTWDVHEWSFHPQQAEVLMSTTKGNANNFRGENFAEKNDRRSGKNVANNVPNARQIATTDKENDESDKWKVIYPLSIVRNWDHYFIPVLKMP